MSKVTASKPAEEVEWTETRRHWTLTKTPTEIRQYVDANVTNLASAKLMLAELAVVISALAKRVNR
jgi:hypothetical protein